MHVRFRLIPEILSNQAGKQTLNREILYLGEPP